MTLIKFPAIVAGHEIFRDEVVYHYEGIKGSVELSMPRITKHDLKKLFEAKASINMLPLKEVFSFLSEVGKLWSNPGYHLLQEALDLMETLSQFSRAELIDDFGYIPPICDKNLFMDNFIAGDFENPDILTDWIKRSGSYVKAMPRGSFLHILAGNVPGVELMSLARGLVTRNLNILKTAAANPVSPVYLLKSFIEIDPKHPITRSTSAFRWDHGSQIEKYVFSKVESACVWGGTQALNATWKYARPGLEILDYGPKRSMVFIGKNTIKEKLKTEQAARNLAWDTVTHDQQACHSPQVAFVEGNSSYFCKELGDNLNDLAKKYPRGGESIDRQSQRTHLRMMSELEGDTVHHPGSHDWTIIETDNFLKTANSPLGRTMFVIPVKSLDDAVKYTDNYTMVAAFSDRDDIDRYKDTLARQGVDRITDLGRMGLFPPGMPHEGRYDLQRLVKFVSIDAPSPLMMPNGIHI